jgi:histidine triad (HIT) family protein
MSACPFCDIVSGETEGSFVQRDDLVSAFLDIRPVNPGHLLVIPNEHVQFIRDVPPDVRQLLFELAIRTGEALRATARADGIDLFLADGEAAGQEVAHAHVHVIPRFEDDGFKIDARAWKEPQPSRAELDQLAKEIKLGHVTLQAQCQACSTLETWVSIRCGLPGMYGYGHGSCS